jgi:hypothetical protein
MNQRGYITGGSRGLRAWTAAAALAIASPVAAGVLDAPIPDLNGQPATAVFYVTGVQATLGEAVEAPFIRNLDTVFTCTSLDKAAPLTFGVEVFTYTGVEVSVQASSLNLKPGETESISTHRVTGLMSGGLIDLGGKTVPGGSARIISTSKKIMCSAVLTRTRAPRDNPDPAVDEVLGPICNLPVVRSDQKGD